MMYQDKFVVAIKSGGKILREAKDLVHLPFGSEFSVLVKNLNSRRAKFTLHIDGQDVLDGTEIIVNANDEVEMKRFIKNGNMNSGNAFKFIERTKKIEDGPRGVKIDDGIVRVEFWFEQQAPVVTTTHHYDVWHNRPRYFWRDYYSDYCGGPYYGSLTSTTYSSNSVADTAEVKLGGPNAPYRSEAKTKGIKRMTSASVNSIGGQSATFSATSGDAGVSMNCAVPTSSTMDSVFMSQENDIGITVPGSKVDQKFQAVYGFNAENISNVITIRMAGTRGAVQVAAPVTVKTKQKCATCGHLNKSHAKFCQECGTGLEIV